MSLFSEEQRRCLNALLDEAIRAGQGGRVAVLGEILAKDSANDAEAAMQAAARDLPDGYDMRVYLESGAGWVEVDDPDGLTVEFNDDTDGSMTERIRNATAAAIEHAKERSK
jgi:hypothetical protein